MYRRNESKLDPVKRAKLNEAFKLFRKHGLLANQDLLCCQSCAGADIASRLSNMKKAEWEKVTGYVFYHRQDKESMPCGYVHLGYGNATLRERKTKHEFPTTEAVGWKIVALLREVGLTVKWDGDTSSRMEIDLAKAEEPAPVAASN